MAVDDRIVPVRPVSASEIGFVVDAAPYFEAFIEACERARRSILIAGWDIHSRLRLRRGDGGDVELRDFLDGLVRERPELEIHILAWDFSMIYALEREVLPAIRFGWLTHPRLHFALDDAHPVGGSQHRKLVVVDDRVAFCGGIDLTMRRWDTPGHEPDDDRRVDPEGSAFRPFHDAAAVLSGPAAAQVGDLVREQWRRATGRTVEPPGDVGTDDPWPPSVEPAVSDVEVGIAVTEAAYDGRPERREIEAAYRAAIATARRSIYLENQFFTSHVVVEALAERLAEPDGPEVLVVGPRRATGWLEQATMGALRERAYARLRDVAGPDRFRLCWPYRRGLDVADSINVHSKVATFDDRILTIGSANLANRSMGLDGECNVWLDAGEGEQARQDVRDAVAALRSRLLAEHLGADPAAVAASVERHGLLRGVADAALAADPERRGLRDVEVDEGGDGWIGDLVTDDRLLDPERPIEARELMRRLAPEHADDASPGPADEEGVGRRVGTGRVAVLVGLAVGLAALAIAWRYGPLGEWLPPERIAAWIESYRDSPLALLWSVVAYTVLGVALFPLTVLIVQTALVFDPWTALLHAMCGSLASAAAGWLLGRFLGRDRLRRGLASSASRFERLVGDPGILTMAAVRLVPIAPYGVVNLLAGALGVRFVPYVVGTALALAPGVAALTVFGDRVAAAVRHPTAGSIAVAAVAGVAAIGVAVWLRRRAGRKTGGAA